MSPHGLSDQKRRSFTRIVQGGGMKLNKFHIIDDPLARYTMAIPSPVAISGLVVVWYRLPMPPVAIRVTSDKKLMNDPAFQIKHIGSITFNIRKISFYQLPQMMLGYDFNGKEIFKNLNIGMFFDSLGKTL